MLAAHYIYCGYCKEGNFVVMLKIKGSSVLAFLHCLRHALDLLADPCQRHTQASLASPPQLSPIPHSFLSQTCLSMAGRAGRSSVTHLLVVGLRGKSSPLPVGKAIRKLHLHHIWSAMAPSCIAKSQLNTPVTDRLKPHCRLFQFSAKEWVFPEESGRAKKSVDELWFQ